jgi:hypothetical protein
MRQSLYWLGLAALGVWVGATVWGDGHIPPFATSACAILGIGLAFAGGRSRFVDSRVPASLTSDQEADISRMQRDGRFLIIPMVVCLFGALLSGWLSPQIGPIHKWVGTIFIVGLGFTAVAIVRLRKRFLAYIAVISPADSR